MLVLLDACCLINLFATDRADEILRALSHDFGVARYVAEEEVLEIEGEPGSTGSGRERLPLGPKIRDLVEGGLLLELDPSSAEETREWVRFAAELDDGEAQTVALAKVRRAGVATDDRKALRILARESMESFRTSELIFPWADEKGFEEGELATILRDVAQRASFIPPRTDPHFERWSALLGLGG